MTPDIKNRNPDPAYLRGLIDQIGLSQRAIARALGIDESLFRKYITHTDNASYRECPYLVQYALEQWAGGRTEAEAKTALPAKKLAAMRERKIHDCQWCGKQFEAIRIAKYCSNRCRQAAKYNRQKSAKESDKS